MPKEFLADSTLRFLDPQEAFDKIMATGGRFFSVTFVKRSTGQLRTMNARLDVDKWLKGGVPKYNPTVHGLVTVADMDRQGFSAIPLESIVEVKQG